MKNTQNSVLLTHNTVVSGLSPTIYVMSEEYPGNIPVVAPYLKRPTDHFAFFDKKTKDLRRRYTKTLIDLKDSFSRYTEELDFALNLVHDLLTDYDKEVVLPNTCALGIYAPSASDIDAKGDISSPNAYEYPDELIQAVTKHYRSLLPRDKPTSMSLPRGKYLGYPFMIPGVQRLANDIFLSIMVALNIGLSKSDPNYDSNPLKSIYDFLFSYHGAPFALEGHRSQVSGKVLPIIIDSGVYSSHQFAPRFRIISMVSKFATISTRSYVKHFLGAILASPFHLQSRDEIKKRIDMAISSGWQVISMDHSQFDQRHGGKRGLQQLRLQASVLDSEAYFNASLISWEEDVIVTTRDGLYSMPGDLILKSGLPYTTLVGCTGNVCSLFYLINKLLGIPFGDIESSRGSTWDALCWGDDTVLMLRDAVDFERISSIFSEVDLDVTVEPTVKYLGFNYARGGFAGTMHTGYSLGRFVQQQFFPERKKVSVFNRLGYMARITLLDPSIREVVHARFLPHFERMDLGEPFELSNITDEVAKASIEIMNHSEDISSLDDIFNIFLHGLGTDAEEIDLPDEFRQLFGLIGTVDMSDPVSFLADLDVGKTNKKKNKGVDPLIITLTRRLVEGDVSVYPVLISHAVNSLNLQFTQGDVIY